MITTGFDARVKVQQIIDNQLPEFLLTEAPKASEFLKQYYIGQEYQGGPIDIAENLDQYLSFNNMTQDVISGITSLTSAVSSTDTTINVDNTKGFPKEYGLFGLNDEVITYTGITTNSFTGCIRGFSGITSYRDPLNSEELVFSSSTASSHENGLRLNNLSALFLKEFYKKLKVLLAPGFEDVDFVKDLDINKFIKQIRDFYQSKGTNESFRILFNVLFGYTPKILNLEDFLIKPSKAEFIRREVLVCERISGDPNKLVGHMVQNADLSAAGPVSEVEIISRNNREFYKIQLFAGFDERSLIQGNFTISPKTKVTDTVSIGSSVITVDSTVGFTTIGTLTSGSNTITYTNKNVNQFFGCSGVTQVINTTDDIRSQDTIFGYEEGNTTKKVVLRITGVLSDIKDKSKFGLLLKDDLISVKNLGEKIENKNRNFKEFAFNTWQYNLRTRYEIDSFNANEITLFENADPSSLKIGDTVDILNRNAESTVNDKATVTFISEKTIRINQNITVPSYTTLSIRKRYDYAGVTSPSNLNLSSSNILADVQNVYNENDEYMYAASNSFPKYGITKKTSVSSFNIVSGATPITDNFKGYDSGTNNYSILSFAENVPFITGDEIVYTSSGVDNVISGLKLNEVYHVEVIKDGNNTKQIRLFESKSFIGTTNWIKFDAYTTTSTHSFTLRQHSGRNLAPKKALTKIPLVPNIQSGTDQPTKFGPVGVMVNGVEILNYKTDDRIYYGPVKEVRVYNKGTGYDVINPPSIICSKPAVGVGTTALLTAVVRGSVKDVLVDPQNFNIQRIVSATVNGGNGTDAEIQPLLAKQYREVEFNASQVGVALTGGVDIANETIEFAKEHRFMDGDPIVYNPSGNAALGIGTFAGSNTNQDEYLVNGSIYYAGVINPRAIHLYKTLDDYTSGINTVGFTTINTGGMHKFRELEAKDVISEFKILNPGYGYENRNLKVSPLGITTSLSIVNFPNHGFSDGEIVNYTYETTPIIGLSSENSYYVMKIDANSFQLSNVGIDDDTIGSVSFDGDGDRLDIGGHSDFVLGSGDFTFECWIKTAVSSGDAGRERRIWQTHGGNNAVGNFQITVDSSPAGTIHLVDASSGSLDTNGTKRVDDNVWHHIAVTRSSGTLRLFIDGVLDASTGYTTIISANSGSPQPRIGSATATAGNFNGNISNLRIIKGAARYVSNFTVSKAPLEKLDGTILLCCKNAGSATASDISPSIITATNAVKSSASPFFESKSDYYYESRNFVRFKTPGTGYQSISYPPVTVDVQAELTGGSIGTITATPLVRGEIVDVFVYENGAGYGSKILNFERKPTLTIKNGLSAQLKPIIKDGKLIEVEVQNGGSFYNAAPDLEVKGKGDGARIRAVVEKGRIIDIIVLNRGTNYEDNNTSISIIPPGRNCVLDPSVRPLTVNNYARFGEEVLYENENDLSYTVVGFSTLRDGGAMNDPNPDTGHSRVIGWANDGNPIYGPYGYSDPQDITSTIIKLETGYVADQYNVVNRPTLDEFALGYFVEDYKFDNSGQLDYHNGRFTKTPEFPNGIYAYHVGVTTVAGTNNLMPQFPYFIGDTYRSNPSVSVLNQNFEFNESSLIRNTYPYRVSQDYSGNDFLIESNETYNQTSIVESASRGSIDSLKIINPGTNYQVGNSVDFVNKNTEGGGAIAEVVGVDGLNVVSIETTYDKFENSVITWENQNELRIHTNYNSTYSPKVHNLLTGDRITISGINTHVDGLLGSHIIGVTSETTYLTDDLAINSGVVTDIYVSSIPPLVGAGSSVGIGTETFKVIRRYDTEGILRVQREWPGIAHTIGSDVYYKSDSFTIPLVTEYFDSKKDDKVYFNPKKSVGVGVGTGIESSITDFVGNSSKTVSVQTQSIYIPNHPFKNNQTLTLKKKTGDNPIQVRNTSSGPNLNLPSSGDAATVYVINKSKDFIGIVTQIGLTTNTSGLFFNNNGSDSYEYSLETSNTRLTGTSSKIKSLVSISTVHSLMNQDNVTLDVRPNLSLGIDEKTEVKIKYNNTYNKVLVDPVGFNSTSVKSSTYGVDRLHSSFNLNDHKLKSGDKIFYSAGDDDIAAGLDTGSYFVYKIDDHNFRLTNTYLDVFSDPPKIISIGSTGGAIQEISKVNPQIPVIKNNNVVFNIGDGSLVGYDFKLFYDQTVNNEFVSTGTTNTFSIVRSGNIGVDTSASVSVTYNDDIPTKLYYSLEKTGVSVKPDKDVKDYAEILYRPSVYNGTFTAFGIGSTSFYISLDEPPERLTYVETDCKVLKYSTDSKTASGPITKLNIISSGSNYKKLPTVSGLSTATAKSLGRNAIIKPESNTIGRLNAFRIINEGFEYSSDKTLSPQADIFTHIGLEASQKISRVEVISGGRNYISPPDIVVVNEYTKNKVETGLVRVVPNFSGNSIEAIEIVDEPRGLDAVAHRIYTLNNSNGIQVVRVKNYAKSSGIVELELNTPAINGFIIPPFVKGDEIFVEGIGKKSYTDALGNVTSPGDGFNSTDHNYNFFRVLEYTNSNPAVLKYNIGDYTSNAGDELDAETNFTAIVKSQNYPEFSITRVPSLFFVEEFLKVNNALTDLQVKVSDENFIKVIGDYEVKVGDVLVGATSGNFATVNSIDAYDNRFVIDYANKKEFGWKDNVGRLSDDLQVLPDNDYFQNLSYTVKSPVTWEKMVDPVNKLVHPVGMKNFADTEVLSKTQVAIGVTQSLSPVLDFISLRRVDTISNFDLVADYNPGSDFSRFITFKSKKLSGYINCVTNRVLQIDDISNNFSSSEMNRLKYVDVDQYSITDFYSKYIVQVTDEEKQSSQVSEVIVLNNYTDTYTTNKIDVFTDVKLGDFGGNLGEVGDPVLRFTPVNPNDYSYNIKVYRESFDISPFNIGVGYTDIGFTRLMSKTERVGPFPGGGTLGISTDVFVALPGQFNSFYTYAHIRDEATERQNYYEIAGYYDGKDTHIAESYFDTQNFATYSGPGIGTFDLKVENNILKLGFNNNTGNNVTIKAKTVGIGTTTAGTGSYRYLVADQIAGSERTARLDSVYVNSVGLSSATLFTLDQDLEFTAKSIIKVGVGSTAAIHNLWVTVDETRANIQHSPFISIGSTSGIGTFTTSITGTTVAVKFWPDPEFVSDNVTIQGFNNIIYSDRDLFNIPSDYTYGTSIENITNAFYGSLNEFGKDKVDFDLNYNRIPIYEKTFNPKTATILNRATGLFSIDSHFFETGEELIYTPDSTLIGVPGTALGIGSARVDGAQFTADVIAGFATVTGIANTTGMSVGKTIEHLKTTGKVIDDYEITGIHTSYNYFVGTASTTSTVITGIANTTQLSVGSIVFNQSTDAVISGSGSTITNIGINSITMSANVAAASAGAGITYYSTDVDWALTLNNVSVGATFRERFEVGVTTTIAPTTVYAIKVTKDTFKLTGTRGGTDNNPGLGFTFTSTGSGNYHRLEMKKKNEKALITVDGVTQYPLMYTPLSYTIENNASTIGAGLTYLALSGISSIKPRDIVKLDDEFLDIRNVGFATQAIGPITGVGTFPVIQVDRGFVGTAKTTHSDGSSIRIYKGAFNIVGNKIWFTDAPDGRGDNTRLNSSALPKAKSTFNGRVYLRRDYTGNKVYDDVSLEFNGIGQTFTVYKEGQHTSGVEAGSDLVFINDVFQTPNTVNNAGNNYAFGEASGITSVTFTGVTRPDTDDQIIVDYDINQNQLPRGGVVVSLGNTGGLGYAPLVGASVTTTLNADGGITSIGIGSTGTFGSGYYGNVGVAVSDPEHVGTAATIVATVGAQYPHRFVSAGTSAIYYGGQYAHTFVGAAQSAVTKVGGASTTPSGATYNPATGVLVLTFANAHGITASDFIRIGRNTLTFTCTKDNNATQHVYPRATDPVDGKNIDVTAVTTSSPHTVTVNVGISTIKYLEVSDALYNPSTGDMVVTSVGHGQTAGNIVGIATTSLSFKCGQDGYSTAHAYPRLTDPANNKSIAIGTTTLNTFTLNVGKSQSGDGGQLTFNIIGMGTGYVNPRIWVDNPAYQYLGAKGISRLGLGNTSTTGIGLSMTYEVAPTTAKPQEDRYGDAAGLIRKNKNLIGEVAVQRMLDKYNGPYEHKFDAGSSTLTNAVNIVGAGNLTPNAAAYNASTGILTLGFAGNHGLVTNAAISIVDRSLAFKCALDNFATSTLYPRGDDPVGSGRTAAITKTSNTEFTVNVGVATFKVASGVGTFVNQDCVDDVVDVVEQVAYNTEYGGNDRIYDAANLYITGAHVADEEPQTIYAFQQARDMAIQAMRNERIGIGSGGQYVHKFVTSGTNAVVSGGDYPHTFVSAGSSAVFSGGDYAHTFVSATSGAVRIGSWVGAGLTPTQAVYTPSTGLLTFTVSGRHNLRHGVDTVGIATNSLTFTCARDNHATEHTYPRTTDPVHNLINVAVASTTLTKFTVNVGVSTLVYHPVSAAAYTPGTGDLTMTVGNLHGLSPATSHTISTATYTPRTGICTFTLASHGFAKGEYVKIDDGALKFTCAKDNHAGIHTYPRLTDPASGRWLPILNVATNTFEVNVGYANSDDVGIHTLVSVVNNSLKKAVSNIGINTASLTFTCARDSHATQHAYPRAGYAHTFVSATTGAITPTGGTAKTPTGATYDGVTGDLVLTIPSHGLTTADSITIAENSLTFTCALDNHATNHAYPRATDPVYDTTIAIIGKTTNTITVNVGRSGTNDPVHKAVIGVGATAPTTITVNVGVTTLAPKGISTATYAPNDGKLVFTAPNHGLRAPTKHTITTCTYTPNTGVLVLNIPNHQFNNGDYIKIKDDSILMTCAKDNHRTQHSYPRPSDTVSNKWLSVSGVGINTFAVDVGISPDVSAHTFVSAKTDGIERSSSSVGIATTSLTFTCDRDAHATQHHYPRGTDFAHNESIQVDAVDGNTFTVNVGVSSTAFTNYKQIYDMSVRGDQTRIPGSYTVGDCANVASAIDTLVGIVTIAVGASVLPVRTPANPNLFSLSKFDIEKPGYSFRRGDVFEPIGIVTAKGLVGARYAHKFVEAESEAIVSGGDYTHTFVRSTSDAVFTGGRYDHIFVSAAASAIVPKTTHPWIGIGITPTAGTYNATTGELILEFSNDHNFQAGTTKIGIATNSIVFTCARDNHATQHAYPRTSDPVYQNGELSIGSTTLRTLTVNVGVSTIVNHPVSIGTYIPATGALELTVGAGHSFTGVSTHTISTCTYTPSTGTLDITVTGHGFSAGEFIQIPNNSLRFTCAKDNHATFHTYPRSTDPNRGKWLPIQQVGVNTFQVNVGEAKDSTAGIHRYVSSVTPNVPAHLNKAKDTVGINTRSLTFTCQRDEHATEHSYPRVTDPVHNREVGITTTTATTITLDVGISTIVKYTPTGANYNPDSGDLIVITNNEHRVKVGDPIGINTNSFTFKCAQDGYLTNHKYPRLTDPANDALLGVTTTSKYTFTVNVGASPIARARKVLTFTVEDTFSDSFGSWQLGEFDYIDSVKDLQDGKRTRFPLYKNSELLSFQKDESDAIADLIDFDAILLIYVNGVMQEPKVSYTFTGGTTFTFLQAPLKDDKVDIFFYRGTRGVDSREKQIPQTVKPGDNLQINKNDANSATIGQDQRTVSRILASDQVETGIYLGDGIDAVNYKPVDWSKQKRDILIDENPVYKVRDSLEGLVFPTAKIIKDLGTEDVELFVDDAQFFNYEENESVTDIDKVSGLVLIPAQAPTFADLNASISGVGTVSSVNIISGGSNYTPGSTISLKIAPPVGSTIDAFWTKDGATNVGIHTVFKTEISGIGSIGVGATVINGISTTGIRLGQTIQSIPNVLGNPGIGLTVIGITSEYKGQFGLIDNSGGSIYFADLTVGIGMSSKNTSPLNDQFNFGRYEDQKLATATATVSAAGTISNITITAPGAGYTSTNLPKVIAPVPAVTSELITGIRFVQGFTGIITGITTSIGVGHPLALTFYMEYNANDSTKLDDLTSSHYIHISQTTVGHGITSVDDSNTAVVAVGTTFADNIYKVNSISRNNLVGIITCNIHTGINTSGIHTMGGTNVGRLSWGRLAGFTRNNSPLGAAVSGYTVNPGLTTFPTIQRRGYGLRDTGSLRKDLGL